MSDARVPGLGPILLLTLLCGLLWTSAWETSSKAKCGHFSACPKGYQCCEAGCCPKYFFISPLRDFLICLSVIAAILCCCGTAKHFCVKRYHRMLQQGLAGPRPQPPSAAAAAAPREEIQAAAFGPPPSYSEVILKPTLFPPPTEPPPPYSLRPEDHTSMQGGIDNLASDLALPR